MFDNTIKEYFTPIRVKGAESVGSNHTSVTDNDQIRSNY